MMNILFVSYPHVGLGNGGMYRQILNTKTALESEGAVVSIHDFMRNELDDVDVCHVFGTNSCNHQVINYCKQKNIPIVISTVFSRSNVSWFRSQLEVLMARRVPGFLGELRLIQQSLQAADCIVALNAEEVKLLNLFFNGISDKIIIIPNGIDPSMLMQAAVTKRERVVLNVGVVNANKNQLNLIRAAENADWNLIIVGPLRRSDYVDDCLALASGMKNVEMIGELAYGSPQLRSLYQRAMVFCLPSHSEVQPITLIEAAGHNCNLVVSNTVPVQNFFESKVLKINPQSPEQIRAAIEYSLTQSVNTWESVANEPSWQDIAKNIMKIYARLA